MTEQMQDVQEIQETPDTSAVDFAHKLFLAGIGAVSLFQEELKKGIEGRGEFAAKLVERGEEITQERREQMAEEARKRQETVVGMGQNVTGAADATYKQYSTAALHRMNVPSRSDIQDLSEQIDALNSKLDMVGEEQPEALAA